MRGFVLRSLLSAIGIWIAAATVPGMEIRGLATLVAAGFLLGIVNGVMRPVITVLTLPITLVTLGFFLLVINAAMLGLVAYLLPEFELRGFFPALLGSIVVSLTGWVGSWWIGPTGRVEVVVVERRPR